MSDDIISSILILNGKGKKIFINFKYTKYNGPYVKFKNEKSLLKISRACHDFRDSKKIIGLKNIMVIVTRKIKVKLNFL